MILESGLGNDWLVWQKVQGKLMARTKVCSYDRAGIGWSAPRPGSRDALTIAKQLHSLLTQAGISGSLLLVGHSAGGLYARAFAGLFQDRVAGLVLVDASSPEMFAASEPAPRRALLAERHRQAPWLYLRVATGWSRMLDSYCNPNTMQRIPAVEDLARAADCRPAYMNSWLGEWDEFEPGAKEIAKLPCCDSLPLAVISRDPNGDTQWDTIQEQLKHLSSRGIRIVARGSGHYVMVDRPELVSAGVGTVMDEIYSAPLSIRDGETVWR